MSVAAHLVSPPSAGLFHRAILQSNPFTIRTRSRELALETGQRFAEKLNCTFDLECLRTKTVREIATNGNVGGAGKEALVADMMTWGPTVDGFNALAGPRDAFQRGDAFDIPVIIGTNSDEAVLFQDIVDAILGVVSLLVGEDLSVTMDEATYRTLVGAIYQDRADDVVAFFPPQPNNGSNYDTFVRILTLYMFTCPSRQVR